MRLAERLLAKLPSHLTKVFFVNSGSEANDLALRLARMHTGGSDVVVVEHGYHGHTIACLDVSPYKHVAMTAHFLNACFVALDRAADSSVVDCAPSPHTPPHALTKCETASCVQPRGCKCDGVASLFDLL